MNNYDIIPVEKVGSLIYFVRGQKVLLDEDLAKMYGVRTGALTQAVRRNIDRFPNDFMLELSLDEYRSLMSQSVTSKRGGRRKPPMAFTEQGVAMLSTVLNSDRAIHVNIAIMRTFVRLRKTLATNEKLSKKILEMEKKYDEQFRVVFETIHQLLVKPERETRKIGFKRNNSSEL